MFKNIRSKSREILGAYAKNGEAVAYTAAVGTAAVTAALMKRYSEPLMKFAWDYSMQMQNRQIFKMPQHMHYTYNSGDAVVTTIITSLAASFYAYYAVKRHLRSGNDSDKK
ncbi:MAG: hypothetical protein KGI06_05560 [Candidatus Micrarchaeota archaeon]|nr:hypothetical protein [Candidatus Micrarchaeota archaeon]